MKETKYEIKLSTLFLSYHHEMKHAEFNFGLTKQDIYWEHTSPETKDYWWVWFHWLE